MFEHRGIKSRASRTSATQAGWHRSIPWFVAGFAAALCLPRVRLWATALMQQMSEGCCRGDHADRKASFTGVHECPGRDVEENPVDEADWESFPASDPPGYGSATITKATNGNAKRRRF
ncbi:MAG TPA: hypothetical protein VHZ24_07915 [Pirellulales bacterium]|jgi:hypothetical protein|nr:hypothetical protein [Pirellulales bacterium]